MKTAIRHTPTHTVTTYTPETVAERASLAFAYPWLGRHLSVTVTVPYRPSQLVSCVRYP